VKFKTMIRTFKKDAVVRKTVHLVITLVLCAIFLPDAMSALVELKHINLRILVTCLLPLVALFESYQLNSLVRSRESKRSARRTSRKQLFSMRPQI